jgi:glycine betaine catabolism B
MVNDIDLRITQIIQRASNVKSVRLAIQDPVYRAGQFCCVSLKQEPVCKRYLSISSSPTEKGYIEFTKRITQSDFSSALDALKEGDSLKIQYPFGKFTLDDPKVKIAFLSGGIGITPIRSICKCVVDNNLGTDMILVYANRSIKDIVFRQDFDQMQKVYPKLKVVHVLCEPEPDFKCTVGLINAQVIKDEVPDSLERKFYLCGPPPMVVAMEKILAEELKINKENIITEQFQGY